MAMKQNLQHSKLFNCQWMTGMGFDWLNITATADMPLGKNFPPYLNIDPGGAVRTVLLPAEADFAGKFFFIRNAADSGAETLTVEEDSSTTAIVKIEMGQTAMVFCDGTSWTVLNKSSGASAVGTTGEIKVVKVALTAVTSTTAGGVLAWANPEGRSILVTRFIIDVTTKSTGAATCDFGVAADGTTTSDTLLDGVDVGTAVIVADNIENQGTNGGSVRKMTSTQYITGTASATLAGLVGSAYIHYHLA